LGFLACGGVWGALFPLGELCRSIWEGAWLILEGAWLVAFPAFSDVTDWVGFGVCLAFSGLILNYLYVRLISSVLFLYPWVNSPTYQ